MLNPDVVSWFNSFIYSVDNTSINDISTRLNNNYVSTEQYIKDEEAITTAFV